MQFTKTQTEVQEIPTLKKQKQLMVLPVSFLLIS